MASEWSSGANPVVVAARARSWRRRILGVGVVMFALGILGMALAGQNVDHFKKVGVHAEATVLYLAEYGRQDYIVASYPTAIGTITNKVAINDPNEDSAGDVVPVVYSRTDPYDVIAGTNTAASSGGFLYAAGFTSFFVSLFVLIVAFGTWFSHRRKSAAAIAPPPTTESAALAPAPEPRGEPIDTSHSVPPPDGTHARPPSLWADRP